MISILRTAAGLWPGLLLLVLLAGCSGLPSPSAPRWRSTAPPPVLSTAYVLGPVSADADLEFDDLAAMPGHAAKLRRAWIQLSLGRAEAAIDTASQVLYAVERPSPSEEALARYVRAEAHARQGHAERGSYDRSEARRLALDPDLLARLQPEPPATGEAAPAPTPAAHVAVLSRANWHAAAPIGRRLDPMQKIFRITVHHSGGPAPFHATALPSCAEEIRSIQRVHMRDRDYGDIGYHFVIDPAGRVWEGRNLRYQGAHARLDNNRGNVGICLLGNFVSGHGGQRPTAAQATSLEQLLRELCGRYHVVPQQVHGHSDFVNTECPGAHLESVLADIVRGLQRGGGGAEAHHVAARE